MNNGGVLHHVHVVDLFDSLVVQHLLGDVACNRFTDEFNCVLRLDVVRTTSHPVHPDDFEVGLVELNCDRFVIHCDFPLFRAIPLSLVSLASL